MAVVVAFIVMVVVAFLLVVVVGFLPVIVMVHIGHGELDRIDGRRQARLSWTHLHWHCASSSSSHSASRPRPTVNTRSASATLATSRAPGRNVCGSPPGGRRLKTSTLSPPTTRAQSATKLVVATTWIGGPEGAGASLAADAASWAAEAAAAACAASAAALSIAWFVATRAAFTMSVT